SEFRGDHRGLAHSARNQRRRILHVEGFGNTVTIDARLFHSLPSRPHLGARSTSRPSLESTPEKGQRSGYYFFVLFIQERLVRTRQPHSTDDILECNRQTFYDKSNTTNCGWRDSDGSRRRRRPEHFSCVKHIASRHVCALHENEEFPLAYVWSPLS